MKNGWMMWLGVLLFAANAPTTAQYTLEQYRDAATDARTDGDWFRVLEFNRTILEAYPEDSRANFEAGQAAAHIQAYDSALHYLRRVTDPRGPRELTPYYLGLSWYAAGELDSAVVYYRQYLEANPANADTREGQRAAEELRKLEVADSWYRTQLANRQRPEHLPLGFANTYRSDLAARMYSGDLYFTTSHPRRLEMSRDDVDEEVTAIYRAAGGVETLADLVFPGEAERGVWMANAALAPDGKTLYYTIATPTDSVNVFRSAIFYSTGEPGNWSAPLPLEVTTTDPPSNNTQPVVAVGKGGRELLFFASDRPDGRGGFDIWCSVREGDTWGPPTNVEAVNSAADERTPYFDTVEGRLYFSSDRYNERSFGNLDIYSSVQNNLGQTPAFRIPVIEDASINSPYDETYYSYDANTGHAYFSSNRKYFVDGPDTLRSYHDTLLKEHAYLCSDIYRVERGVDLELLALDCRTDEPFTTAYVVVTDLETGAAEPLEWNPTRNAFYAQLRRGKRYQITGQRTQTGAILYQESITAEAAEALTEPLSFPVYRAPELTVVVQDDAQRALTDARVTVTQTGDQTGAIVQQPIDNDDHIFKNWRVEHDATYRVRVDAEGYIGTTETITLSAEAACTVDRLTVNLLPEPEFPVVLYFHNDEPGPHTSTTGNSEAAYDSTYWKYIRLQDEYYEEYTEIYPGQREDITRFFQDSVTYGWNQLQSVFGVIENQIRNGQTVEVEILASASARSNPTYNKALSERRIDSVRKYLNEQLRAKGLDAGKLVVTQVFARGDVESLQDGGSANTEEKENIYDPDDARFRRVIIRTPTSRSLGQRSMRSDDSSVVGGRK